MKRYGRIFILPTRFGMVFIVGAVTMILVGATYQNNLVNMLAFFMLSLVFIVMVQTHNNLKDVKVTALEVENGFVGAEYLATTVLYNDSSESCFNIEFSLKSLQPSSVYENLQPLLSHGPQKLRAAYPSPKRGKYKLKEVKITSVYPMGLFKAWAWHQATADFFIYPEPKGSKRFPTSPTGDPITGTQHLVGGDDFGGHRKHQEGDPYRHVDWKAFARGRPMMIKLFNEGTPSTIQLDWNALEGLDTEERLSQLSQWVEEAKLRRLPFGLRLPGLTVPSGQGQAHITHCLEALAVFDSPVNGSGEKRSQPAQGRKSNAS